MITKFNISDLELALQCYKYAFPESHHIDSSELMSIYKFVIKPPIYNINLIIKSLTEYLDSDYYSNGTLYTETELCRILGVKKLTLHEWRSNGYVGYVRLPTTRTIRYNLSSLLDDLKCIQTKNISILGKIMRNKSNHTK